MTTWQMRITCCTPNATNTHSQYVLHTAFPLQQWLYERATLLRYTHIAFLVTTDTECVYCAVRVESSNTIHIIFIGNTLPVYFSFFKEMNSFLFKGNRHHHHYHYHHISFMELGQLLTRFGLTYPEVSSKVYHDSLCQLGSSISLPWVIYFEAFYLHVVSSFSCIPVICPKLVLL